MRHIMKIAVFGGTFDPPHSGHINIARSVIRGGRADIVIFVPSFDPPHKLNHVSTSYEYRRNMLELAIDGEKNLFISDIERDLGRKPSYTLNTMVALAELYPADELILLIGSDSLRLLHTWHSSAELVSRWQMIVYPRKSEMPSAEELSINWSPEIVSRFLSSVLDMPFNEISSSEIRNKMVKNENTGNFICPEVKRYITQNNLYKTGVSDD